MPNDPAAVRDHAEQVFRSLVNQRGADITDDRSYTMQYLPYPKWRDEGLAKSVLSKAAPILAFSSALLAALSYYAGYIDGGTAWGIGGMMPGASYLVAWVTYLIHKMFFGRRSHEVNVHTDGEGKYWLTSYSIGDGTRITLETLSDAYPDLTLPQLMAPLDAEADKARAKAIADAKVTDKNEMRRLNLAYQALDMDRALTDRARTVVDHAHAYKEVSLA